MPLALEPGGRYPVVLESDQEKDNPPTFYFRALNGRKWREAAGMLDALDQCKGGIEAVDRIFDTVRVGLVGWSGMIDPDTNEEIPYDPASLDLVVGGTEATELIHEMLKVGKASRKNSE